MYWQGFFWCSWWPNAPALQVSYAQALLRGIQSTSPSQGPRKVATRCQGDSVLALSQTAFPSLPPSPTTVLDSQTPAAATSVLLSPGRPSAAAPCGADTGPSPGPAGRPSFLAMLHKAIVANVGEAATVASYRDGKAVLGVTALRGGRASPVA